MTARIGGIGGGILGRWLNRKLQAQAVDRLFFGSEFLYYYGKRLERMVLCGIRSAV